MPPLNPQQHPPDMLVFQLGLTQEEAQYLRGRRGTYFSEHTVEGDILNRIMDALPPPVRCDETLYMISEGCEEEWCCTLHYGHPASHSCTSHNMRVTWLYEETTV